MIITSTGTQLSVTNLEATTRSQPAPSRTIIYPNPYRHAHLLEGTVRYAVSRMTNKGDFTFDELLREYPELNSVAPLEPFDLSVPIERIEDKIRFDKKGAIEIFIRFYREFESFLDLFDSPQILYLLHDALPLYFIDQYKGISNNASLVCLHRSNFDGDKLALIQDKMAMVNRSIKASRPFGASRKTLESCSREDIGIWEKFQKGMAQAIRQLRAQSQAFDQMAGIHTSYLDEYLAPQGTIVLVDAGEKGTLPAYITGLFPERKVFVLIAETTSRFFPSLSSNSFTTETFGASRFMEDTGRNRYSECILKGDPYVAISYAPEQKLLGPDKFVETLTMLRMVRDFLP